MRLCRVSTNSETFYGVLEGELVRRLKGAPFEELQFNGRDYPLSTVRLLAPVEPSKIVCIGKNYYAHALEMQSTPPEQPLMFLKPSTSVIGPADVIVYPPDSERVDYEAELGIVISRRCKDVAEDDFQDVILGYLCVNDVTARDLQAKDGQWTRGKGFDTFCPIGPWIETELDPFTVRVESRLNGRVCQSESTSIMMHNVRKLVAYISRVMTLLPGDVIATGTPAGIGPMQAGDWIEVEVEGIGVLRNRVERA